MEIAKEVLLQANKMNLHKPKRGVRILLFHDIKHHQVGIFKELITFLKGRYNFITPYDYERANKDERVSYMISFDDGFSSQAYVAKDILGLLGIKSLVFICPQFIGLNGKEAEDFIVKKMERHDITEIMPHTYPMTWKDLKYLLSCGHVIGAHTLTHSRLSVINEEDELMDEIVSSGNRLEEILGKQIDWFAYPFGDIGSINSKSLKIISSRYHYCCSGLRGINTESTHRMCILRECINLDKPINYLKELVLGGLDFFYYLKRKKLLKMTRF